MGVKFPPNDKIKLIIEVTFITDSYDEYTREHNVKSASHCARTVVPKNGDKNAVEIAVEMARFIPDSFLGRKTKRSRRPNLFVITKDNSVIWYRFDNWRRNKMRLMQTYELPENSDYLYIAWAIGLSGPQIIISNNALAAFNTLNRIKPECIHIAKISANYQLSIDNQYGIDYNPRTSEEKWIDDYLIKCSRNQKSFYDECMKYVPYEISHVSPDGTVRESIWQIDLFPAKNAHTIASPFWYEKMLKWDKPQFWDLSFYRFNKEGPIIDDIFGTANEL